MWMVRMLLQSTSSWRQAREDSLGTTSSGTFPSFLLTKKAMSSTDMRLQLLLLALRYRVTHFIIIIFHNSKFRVGFDVLLSLSAEGCKETSRKSMSRLLFDSSEFYYEIINVVGNISSRCSPSAGHVLWNLDFVCHVLWIQFLEPLPLSRHL